MTPAARSDQPAIRVLHAFKVYQPDQNGGIEEAIFRISTSAPSDVETSILVCRTVGRGSTLMVGGIPVERTSTFGQVSSLPISPAYIPRLRARVKHADVLAFHAPFPLVDIGLATGALRSDQALIVHWHAEIVGRKWLRPLFAPLLHRTVARADQIIVSSQSVIDSSPYLATVREKCRVVPYGIDTQWWSQLTIQEQKAVEGIRSAKPRLVVACGRLVGYKGFDILIRAIKNIDAQLAIIGKGPLEADLKALVAKLGLDTRVALLGFLDRVDQRIWLNAAKVFALSSINEAETFAIAQLEAMSCGCPVVNTSLSSGVPLVARNGKEGITVPPGDVNSLANAIESLLDRPQFAKQLGAAGRVRAQQQYSWDVFSTSAYNVYRTALAERRLASSSD